MLSFQNGQSERRTAAGSVTPEAGQGSGQGDSALDYVLRGLERYRYWILGAVVVWMMLGFNGQWRLGPDTTFYATVARNVVQGRGFVHPTGDASRAGVGIVYLFAADFWLFGVGVIWPLCVAMSVMGLGVLGLTYRLIHVHADRAQAVASTCLLALCADFYRQNLTLLADLPFLLGLMAFLVGYEQRERRGGTRWLNWSLLGAGLLWMAAFKITVIVVIGAWLLAEGWKAFREPNKRWALWIALAAVGGLGLIGWLMPRGRIGVGLPVKVRTIIDQLWVNGAHTLTTIVPDNAYDLLSVYLPEAVFGNKLATPAITITISLIVLAVGFVLFARRALWGLVLVGFVLQWLVFFPNGRYIMVILPLLAFAWWRHGMRLSRLGPSGVGWTVGILILGLWVGMNVPRTLGIVVTQHRQPFHAHDVHGRYEGLLEVGHWLRQHSRPDARILTREKWANPLIFASHRRVVPGFRDHVYNAAASPEPVYWVHLAGATLTWRFRDAGFERGMKMFHVRRHGGRAAVLVSRLRKD